MRYGHPPLRRALAAQYALGTLQGRARRRFEALLQADAQLRAELRWWDERLARLALRLPPRAPPETVWPGLERRAFEAGRTRGARRPGGRPAIAALGWIALAASIVLTASLFLVPRAPVEAPQAAPAYVAELWPQDHPLAWHVDVQPEAGGMKIKVMRPAPADPQHDVELWVIAGGKPVAVGLMPRAGESWLNWPKAVPFTEKLVLAVSYEPAGGSPTGAPTGPVLATGEIKRAG